MTVRAVLLYSSKGALKTTEVLVHHVWPLVSAVLLTLVFTLNFLPDSVYRLEVIHSFTNFVEAQSNMCWWKSSWVFVTIYPPGISLDCFVRKPCVYKGTEYNLASDPRCVEQDVLDQDGIKISSAITPLPSI